MEKFSAESFYQIGKDLAELKAIAHDRASNDSKFTEDPDDWFAKFFAGMGTKFSAIGLRVSAKAAREMSVSFEMGDFSAKEVESKLEILQSTLVWEMEDTKFFSYANGESTILRLQRDVWN